MTCTSQIEDLNLTQVTDSAEAKPPGADGDLNYCTVYVVQLTRFAGRKQTPRLLGLTDHPDSGTPTREQVRPYWRQ